MTTLSVVIPALNEEDGIQEIAARVLSTRPQLNAVGIDTLELIVVDDGSTDQTAAIVASMPDVCLIQHQVNQGYGAALKTGFAAASGEWIGFLDADGTYPPEYFPQLYQKATQENADIVIGSRMAGAESQMPRVRRLGNLIFAGLVSLLSARRITDSASGMRIFKKSILQQIYPLPDGLNLTPVMSTRALHEQIKMVEIPIPYSERVGRSKLNVIRDGMRFAQSITWTALGYNPVRLLGMVGLVALCLAFFIGLGLVAIRLAGTTTVSAVGAFVLFSALILAISGISLLALGISFNYFVALFHKTPVQQGLFGRPLFRQQLDQHFGWLGLLSFITGIGIGVASLMRSLSGWDFSQLWIYYLGSASFTLIGVQLAIAWIQMQVLVALSERESLIVNDLRGHQTQPTDPQSQPTLVHVQETFSHG